MAAITEHVEFSQSVKGVDLLSVGEADIFGNVVTTYSTRSINIVKLEDQKTIHSWSLRHGQRVTSPCVWCKQREEFLVVVNNREILTWKKEETNLEKIKRKTLKCSIHHVFCVQEYEPLILCSNGAVDFLSNIKDTESCGILSASEKITWCHAVTNGNMLCVLFLVKKQNEDLRLICTYIDEENSTWSNTSVNILKPDCVLVNCCCHVDASHIKVYFLWNNGELYCTDIFRDGHFSDFYKIQTLQRVRKYLALTLVDLTHMAVAGVTQTGEVGIGIFDIKFGALQGWKKYPDENMKKLMLFCFHGYLITTSCDKIYACQFECQPSTVASVLGQKKVLSTESPSMKTSHFSWDVVTQEAEEEHSDPNIIKFLTQLTDPNQTPSHSKFQLIFHKWQNIITKKKNSYWLNSGHMTRLTERCLTEKKFWPKNEILWLIQQNCIGPSSVSSLFDALISHTEVSLLHTALNTVLDVPEGCLCKSLQFFLRTSEEELQDLINISTPEKDDLTENTKPVLGPCKAYIVNSILVQPYNDVFLLEWIKSINFKNILLLLNHLCHLLCVQTKEMDNRDVTNSKLTVLKIIDWISLIIDGHMTQFVLSPDARETILKLHGIVENQTQLAKGMVSLEAILGQLRAQSEIPKQQMTGQYCIEVLHVF